MDSDLAEYDAPYLFNDRMCEDTQSGKPRVRAVAEIGVIMTLLMARRYPSSALPPAHQGLGAIFGASGTFHNLDGIFVHGS
jgi:hypothetical protein